MRPWAVRALILLGLPALANAFFYHAGWAKLPALVLWPLVPGCLTVLFWPLVRLYLRPLGRKAPLWGIAGVLSFGGFCLTAWYLMRWGVLPMTGPALALWALSLGAVLWWRGQPRESLDELRELWPRALNAQLAVVLLWNLWAMQASWHSVLFWGEKPMDIAFLSTLVRQEALPLMDPWAQGHATRYYYFGYFQVASLAKLLGLPASMAYQLGLSGAFALSFMAAWDLFALFMGRGRALAAAAALLLSTNLKGALGVLAGKLVLDANQFWGLTRIFDDGLFAEHLVWSFLFADLHPHVMDYAHLIGFFALTVVYWRAPSWRHLLPAALCWALMLVTSTWDAFFAGLFWGLGMLLNLGVPDWKKCRVPLLAAFAAPVLALLMALPLLLDLAGGQPFSAGALERPPHALIQVLHHQGLWWGLFLLGALGLLLRKGKRVHLSERTRWAAGALALAVFLTWGLEQFYLMDPVNSLFKFGNSLFVLSGMAALLLLPDALSLPKPLALFYVLLLSLGIGGGVLSATGLVAGAAHQGDRPTLDGKRFMDSTAPDESRLIDLMNQRIRGARPLLEAYGESFQHHRSRISTFTGLPTHLGWAGHVRIRGLSDDEIMRRRGEIDRAYISSDALKVYEWCREKGIAYVVFSTAERDSYGSAAEDKFRQYQDLFPRLACFGRACLYGVQGADDGMDGPISP